ncbi:tRNA pseudouridine(13) synthase TruD [Psychrobacter sp. FDAARGOS_221]|uniref:tRNA pseudouridine(13) synthase TruD n=1 Tax=Psychrobacter sp. FDAARGOS_221 TaxID=1975705 RepID=UPI000BB5562D|nr:tRNA pseudouridine(13) synthase TruD [Psychrobacter sp. FDAARGOS_221]PNK61182.1 tRNA pseudouridine(13) synthase TruD [Psychrobacter sp. FDAARGOS_221]
MTNPEPTNQNAQPIDSNRSPDITQAQISKLTDTGDLPQPYPAPIASASFKQTPSDFQVDEVLDIDLSGEGEHLWLLIKKTGMNTLFVAQQLAKWAKIPSRDVGYSGLKDRQAVTTQWFSLRIPKGELPEFGFAEFIHQNRATAHNTNDNSSLEALEVLEQVWHSKKLHKGAHKANRFLIRLQDLVFADQQAVDSILETIKTQGVPNYFGEQRFGHDGNNIATALEWFEQGTIHGRKPHPKKSRDLQSLLLSSARSAIFNQVVAQRVTDGSWNTALAGDVFNLDGSGSVFTVEQIDQEIHDRLASGDIHPTGPLWGINNDKVSAEAQALEQRIVSDDPILQRLAQGLENKQIKTMRRALRLPVSELNWSWDEIDNTLVLDFTLSTGSFATSVLANLVAQLDS